LSRAQIRLSWLPIVAAVAACGPGSTPASTAAPAAKVTAAVPEIALTTITLTAEAQKRLGIETVLAERRAIARSRSVGGEIVPAGGARVTVTAPVAGTLGSDAVPAVGTHVEQGQVILSLVPLAPAERDVRIEAERAVAEALGRQEVAANRAERAQQLARDGSGSKRAAEEARAELVVADATLKAARDRLALASRNHTASGTIPLVAPQRAMLHTIHARPGQTVGAGMPLLDLVALDTVWLRVPLFAGDLETVDRTANVTVAMLGASSAAPGTAGVPVAAPPTADAMSAGVDLFYRIPNPDRRFRPGQRVTARIPLRAKSSSLVVPLASILYDALGGTWVYETRDSATFVRQRVAISDLVGDVAIIQQGLTEGTRVVTTGAAELFGTEFGVGK
jgi:membrane fusion protein, heavy metal efflux system